jgi:Mrp family chromosome partitioning ATPase/capsular polysaccharide biosynthesis protein
MPAGRYVTLRDYLRVLRRFALVIGLLAAVGAGAGYANAARQKARYQASVSVSFQDPVSDLNLVGLGSNTFQSPAQLAAVNASAVTAPGVSARVKAILAPSHRAELSESSIAADVSASNGLLYITATSPQPAFAAKYANTLAIVLVVQDNRQVRKQFQRLVAQIEARVATLTHPAKGSPTAEASQSADNAVQLSFYEDELARLQTVAAFATTARVSLPAKAPGAPFSPKKVRSLIAGLLIGLLLGILAAFVRDATDRRLRSSNDVAEGLPFPIVGRIRARSLGRVIRVSDAADKDGWADVEAFRILRRNLEALPSEGGGHTTTVLITSAVPEEGKSTVASSLAVSLALAGKRTLLVDCDLRRPTLATRLELQPTPGLADYLAGEVGPADVLRTIDLTPSFTGVNGTLTGKPYHPAPDAPAVSKLICIPAGVTRRNSPELLGSERFRSFVEQVREAYDVVIFDSSPLLPVADTLEMIPNVDAILLCVRHSRTTQDQAEAARAAIARFETRPTGIVITGLKPKNADSQLYMYAYDYDS